MHHTRRSLLATIAYLPFGWLFYKPEPVRAVEPLTDEQIDRILARFNLSPGHDYLQLLECFRQHSNATGLDEIMYGSPGGFKTSLEKMRDVG